MKKRTLVSDEAEALPEQNVSKKSKPEGTGSEPKAEPKKEWAKMPLSCTDGWKAAVEEEFASDDFQANLLGESMLLTKDEPAKKQRHSLVVLGPSASGKTYGLKLVCALLPVLASWVKNSFVLDGANFRDASKVWAAVKASAISSGYVGYSDAYTTLLKRPTDLLKTKLVAKLMGDGFNIILPDTCSSLSIVREKIKMLKDAGYTINILACVAPKSVCEQRGRSREQGEGKKYSSKNWQNSVEGLEVVINELRKSGEDADFFVLNTSKEECETVASTDEPRSVKEDCERVVTVRGGEKIEVKIGEEGETVAIKVV
jgi:adenylylsulfate kinase-like enzyme